MRKYYTAEEVKSLLKEQRKTIQKRLEEEDDYPYHSWNKDRYNAWYKNDKFRQPPRKQRTPRAPKSWVKRDNDKSFLYHRMAAFRADKHKRFPEE